MQKQSRLPHQHKHPVKPLIGITSSGKNIFPAEVCPNLSQPNKLNFYYLFFVSLGSSICSVDLQEVLINSGQLLFVSPRQLVTTPQTDGTQVYYKVVFDENTLTLLPQQFPFLINLLNKQIINFNDAAIERVSVVFRMLEKLKHSNKSVDTSILLAHLNSLLTELNSAYFESIGIPPSSKLAKYIEFKLAVETNLTEQNSVLAIAQQLSTTTSSLYGVVKEFSGTSPKEFITNRLMLEAQRKLRYSKPSVKELAYELGYSDPDYFSRLFKKYTGKSVTEFLKGID